MQCSNEQCSRTPSPRKKTCDRCLVNLETRRESSVSSSKCLCHSGPADPGVQQCQTTVATLTLDTINDLKQDDNLFETPDTLVEVLIEKACIIPGMLALEPSAGRGAIVKALVKAGAVVHAVEKNEVHKSALVKSGATEVVIQDFLDREPTDTLYDVIVMNPPFANGKKVTDIAHVRMAADHLKPGGRLVAIMSPGFTFKKDVNSVLFRKFVEENGEYEENADGAFKESGTNVKTVIVVLRKPVA